MPHVNAQFSSASRCKLLTREFVTEFHGMRRSRAYMGNIVRFRYRAKRPTVT